MKKKSIWLLLFLLPCCIGWLSYLNMSPKNRYHSYPVSNVPKHETNCIIFFGGGSNSI